MKACAFLMNTAILMHLEFLFGLSKEKSQSSSYYNQQLLQANPSLKYLKDDWQVQGWKASCLRTFHCKLVFQFSSAVIAPEKCWFFFLNQTLVQSHVSRSWDFKGKNANLKTLTGNIMKIIVSWALTLIFFPHSSLSPTRFSLHLKGPVSLSAGRDWLPNCIRLVYWLIGL